MVRHALLFVAFATLYASIHIAFATLYAFGQPHSSSVRATARDVHTSTFLTAFKPNASGRNALSLLGRDYLVAAQQPKGVLHFWAWHKARFREKRGAA